jgi:D-alanyl-D-alanine carboxypeptidase/D-alanyl-D-alanine-endopeptidase (penicillin-binding protein 4)
MTQSAPLAAVLVLLSFACARADLASDIQAVLNTPQLKNTIVGIDIIRIGKTEADSGEIYQHEAKTLLLPASNLKLTTTSAALDRFGADFNFQTSLYLHNDDLVLVGDGDPSFGDAEYLKRVGWKPTTVFENWAAQLKKLNVKSIHNVIVDDSIFDQQFFHPHWPARQADHWYEAEVAGMNMQANCVTVLIQPGASKDLVQYGLVPSTHYVTVENTCITGHNDVQLGRKPGTNDLMLHGEAPPGAVSSFQQTIHDPPMYAGTILAETMAASGIPVKGQITRISGTQSQRQAEPKAWRIVGIHETPLAVALARANKDSINLYAECLCKRLGFAASHQTGSWENGTAAVAAFLNKAGVPSSEFHLDDGSGLSKQNHITPSAITRVLVHDFFIPSHDAFVNSLAVSGVDGTLEDRFRNTDLLRRVFGKSGYVEGVSCLSGYLRTKDNQWYAFSILMNHISSHGLGKGLQEKIVRAIDVNAAGH